VSDSAAGVIRRVGVLGGTFDPPHIGHASLIGAAISALNLSQLRVVVANDPWQKSVKTMVTPVLDRLAMTKAMCADLPAESKSVVLVDDRELSRGGPSYMADTLAELTAEISQIHLFLLLGADAAALLETWVHSEEIRGLATIAVFPRSGETHRIPKGWDVVEVAADLPRISSTSIRTAFFAGTDPRSQLTPSVSTLIAQRQLYSPGTVAVRS